MRRIHTMGLVLPYGSGNSRSRKKAATEQQDCIVTDGQGVYSYPSYLKETISSCQVCVNDTK